MKHKDKRDLTIFLAAPDRDTGEFRRIIEDAVDKLRLAHANDLRIDLKRWDDPKSPVPCSFLHSPQHDVLTFTGDPGECDLVVGVFAHHFGSQLTDELVFGSSPDGDAWYCTEWEINRAINASRNGVDIDVLVFHDETPYADLPQLSRADNRKRRGQSDLVADFIDTTRDGDGNVRGGVNAFRGMANLFDVAFTRLGVWTNEWKRRHLHLRHSESVAAAVPALVASARQRELLYLTTLLSTEFSDREERYVTIAAEERRTRSFDSTLRGLRMPTSALLSCFKLGRELVEKSEPSLAYADALDAYRSLHGRRHRRLAVLGEPGAGKSFSLERIACEYARAVLLDASAPLPLLVRLGAWTNEAEPLLAFIVRQLGTVGGDFADLQAASRCVLLLDGLNEIPPGQRRAKAEQVKQLAGDDRQVALLVSCRERDFSADFQLPFDTLTLQPLTPLQIHAFLDKAMKRHHDDDIMGARAADERFWQLAGGAEVADVWATWQQAGASWQQFWTVDDIPRENPNVFGSTSGAQDQLWRRARLDRRGLLALAANPYLLTVMMMLPVIPANRAQLFEGFIRLLYEREQQAREQRTDAASVPPFESWHAAMVGLAEALQRVDGEQGDDGARTSLGRNCWPSSLQADPRLIDFGIDASVLQRSGDELRFTHQLLQESLASHVMLQASRTGKRAASDFWPTARWWQRSGWEVVAEIAAEACGDADGDLHLLLDWLAAVNPEVAALAWQRAGAPTLPEHLSQAWADQWMPRMTDIVAEPDPAARAAIGRALGTFDLDRRPGIGLGVDGMPDIDWVTIADHGPFAYQRGQHDEKSVRVPAFKISRYPVTNRQFQAFINAGGYLDKRWWQGLAQHIDEPMASAWQEPNAPRECVSWFEAVAFCRWLSAVISAPVTLPTEMQWERAAAGPAAHTYPWSRAGGGEGYQSGLANIDETSDKTGPHYLGRTSAVGIYPGGGSIEGVLDLAGNVWEWCLNDDETPENTGLSGDARRAVRGGSWYYHSGYCRAACRYWFTPEFRYYYLGFRVVCCPIQEP